MVSLKRILKPFRINHRNAGIWSLFSMWLAVLFAITYWQTLATGAAYSAYAMMLDPLPAVASPHAALFRFQDDAGVHAANATVLLLLCLMLGVLRPRYRFPLMTASVAGTFAVASGILEKSVYATWAAGNENLLAAETVRASAGMASRSVGEWTPRLRTLLDLDPMLQIDLAVMVAAAAWAVACLLVSRKRMASA